MIENTIQDLINALNRNTDAILATFGKNNTPELKVVEEKVKKKKEVAVVVPIVEVPKVQAEDEITIDDVRRIATQLLEIGKREDVVKVNSTFNITRLSEAKDEQLKPLFDKLTEIYKGYEQTQ
jgi:hypothetical protein